MKISFYFDTSCPWCWITSRWITQVEKQRDITVEFKPFSLALKNNALDSEDNSGYFPEMRRNHKLLRIISELIENGDKEKVRDFYTRAGEKIHIESNETLDWVADVLNDIGVDASLIYILEDKSQDQYLQDSIDSAIAVVGDDVGVPLFVIEDEKGKRGFFGPVISQMPSEEEGLALWDGISVMASFPHFYELKRTRNVSAETKTTEGHVD